MQADEEWLTASSNNFVFQVLMMSSAKFISSQRKVADSRANINGNHYIATHERINMFNLKVCHTISNRSTYCLIKIQLSSSARYIQHREIIAVIYWKNGIKKHGIMYSVQWTNSRTQQYTFIKITRNKLGLHNRNCFLHLR